MSRPRFFLGDEGAHVPPTKSDPFCQRYPIPLHQVAIDVWTRVDLRAEWFPPCASPRDRNGCDRAEDQTKRDAHDPALHTLSVSRVSPRREELQRRGGSHFSASRRAFVKSGCHGQTLVCPWFCTRLKIRHGQAKRLPMAPEAAHRAPLAGTYARPTPSPEIVESHSRVSPHAAYKKYPSLARPAAP